MKTNNQTKKIEVKDVNGKVLFVSDEAQTLKEAIETAAKKNIPLIGADLRNLDLRGADLRCADFTFCNSEYANFEGANLCGACFVNAYMRNANLTNIITNYQTILNKCLEK